MKQIEIEPPKRSSLPSLLSCALALVMAGSLVLFSLVAQKTVLSQTGSQRGSDQPVAPAAPPANDSRAITVDPAEDLSRSPLDVLEDVGGPVELTFGGSRPPATGPPDDALALLPRPERGPRDRDKEGTPGKPKRGDKGSKPDIEEEPNEPGLGSPGEPEPEHRAASEEDRKGKKLKKDKKSKKPKKTHREPPAGDGGHANGHHKHDKKKNKSKGKGKNNGKNKSKGKGKNNGKSKSNDNGKSKTKDEDEKKDKGESGGDGFGDDGNGFGDDGPVLEGSYEEDQATENGKIKDEDEIEVEGEDEEDEDEDGN